MQVNANISARQVMTPITGAEAARGREITGADKDETRAQQSSAQTNRSSDEQQQRVRLVEEGREVQRLAQRDREVRAHEQAHAAIGGRYASAPHYDYEQGPNGRQYAVSGHVNIDTSEVAGDPAATLEKARVVQRAALAPAEPSPQDRKVAAAARQMALQAQVELAELQVQEAVQNSKADAAESEASDPAEEPSKQVHVNTYV